MLDKQTQPFFKITEFFRNLPRNCSSLKINKTQQYQFSWQQNMIHTNAYCLQQLGDYFVSPVIWRYWQDLFKFAGSLTEILLK